MCAVSAVHLPNSAQSAIPLTPVRAAMRIRQVIDARHGDVRWKLERECLSMGVKPQQIARLFLRLYGQKPKAYQQTVRLRWACDRLLVEQGTKVESIASECGYARSGDFIDFFRRYMRTTPAVYRGERLGAPVETSIVADSQELTRTQESDQKS